MSGSNRQHETAKGYSYQKPGKGLGQIKLKQHTQTPNLYLLRDKSTKIINPDDHHLTNPAKLLRIRETIS